MKITLVARSFDPTRGGQEQYLHRLTDSFLKNDHQVTVVSERYNHEEPDDPNIVYRKTFPLKLESGTRRLWFNWRARKIAGSIDSDLIFSTGKVSFGDFYRAGGGVHETFLEQCVPYLNQFKPKHFIQSHLQRSLFNNNPDLRVMVNSKMVRDDILNRYDVDPEQLEVIYNGIDTETYNWKKLAGRRDTLRKQFDIEPDDFVCLFTAGGWKRKGLPLVLETFSALTDENLKLFVVGHTKESKLKKAIKNCNLEDQVFYHGFVDNIEEYYAAADGLVFPSRYDPGASVVPEALASGLPVITSRWNGTHELVDEAENGFVLDKLGSPDELESLIKKLQEMDRDRMREKAYRKGKQFTMEKHFEQVFNFVKSAT